MQWFKSLNGQFHNQKFPGSIPAVAIQSIFAFPTCAANAHFDKFF